MSGTYKAIGINVKGMPLGESDRLLTVLTREFGLIRMVAPGARKHKSKLGGRSGLFVVNELLIAKGRNLDKLIQAETLESYPRLSLDLGKLTASQYLAELVLFQALSDQPQEDLFCLMNDHLRRLEQVPRSLTLISLNQATFHLLALAGLAPQVQSCCLTQQSIQPDFSQPDWHVGFSAAAGGTVHASALEQLASESGSSARPRLKTPSSLGNRTQAIAPRRPRQTAYTRLDALELYWLQQLAQPQLLQLDDTSSALRAGPALAASPDSERAWLSVERVLRQYAQYHFDQPIRSATLIDTCFLSLPESV